MKLMQFDGLVVNVDNVTHIEVCDEDVSTVIHFVSGEYRVVQSPYREVYKRLYKLTTGASVSN